MINAWKGRYILERIYLLSYPMKVNGYIAVRQAARMYENDVVRLNRILLTIFHGEKYQLVVNTNHSSTTPICAITRRNHVNESYAKRTSGKIF